MKKRRNGKRCLLDVNPHGRERSRKFLEQHVRHHISDLGMDPETAVRVAYEEARRQGLDVPGRPGLRRTKNTRSRFYTVLLPSGRISRTFARKKTAETFKKKYGGRVREHSGGQTRETNYTSARNTTSARNQTPEEPVIGELVEEITYRGGHGKRGSSRWVHSMDTAVQLVGQKDGTVLLRSKTGLPLWDWFDANSGNGKRTIARKKRMRRVVNKRPPRFRRVSGGGWAPVATVRG